MKTALHLMLDFKHPYLRLFWRRHGLRIMERLTPAALSFVTAQTMLEQELRKVLQSGGKRLIILGSPALLSQTFHLLMKEFEQGHSSCEVGFWEVRKAEALSSLFQSSENFTPLLHTFRNGHAVPVNVIKARYTEHDHELTTAYFWNELHVYAGGPRSRSLVTIGEDEWSHNGKVRYRLSLHQEPLHSWRINHSNLLKANYLQVFSSTPASASPSKITPNPSNGEVWLNKGEFVQLHGNYLRIAEPNAGWVADTQQLQVEVLPRSLYLLIPMIPVRSAEPARANLLAFKPRPLVVASRQRPSQETIQSTGDSRENLFADDSKP